MAIKINGVTVISDSQAITSTSTISATGNVSGGNIVTTGSISATTVIGNVQSSGPVSTTGNVTGGNILTGGAVSATGNITASFFVGNGSQLTGIDATQIQSGTSNIKVVSSGGNVTASVGGTSNVLVIASAGTVTTGTASVSGNITGGNIAATNHTGTNVSVTGTQTAASTVGGVITGTSTSVTGTQTAASTVGGVITGSSSSLSGNITGGNILTAGQVSATGNLTGGAMTINGNAVITGNLRVDGTETIFNTQTLTINDKDIIVANNVTGGANVNGAGLQAGNPATATWFFNNATTSWQSNIAITPSANATLNLGGTSNYWATLFATGVSATGNISGGNLNVTGNIVDSGALSIITGSNGNIALVPNGSGQVTVTGALSVSGNITAGNINGTIVATSGNFGTGNVLCGNVVNNNANGVGNIGSSSTFFNTVFAKATSAQYADLAEKYTADAEYAPGTVLVFGGTHEVTVNAVDADRRVAGVVSTNPSYIMNSGLESEHVATVALTGRVPTMIVGTVRKGDLMVAAGLGRARAEADPRVGTVIGKALEDFDGIEGTIEVVVGRF
jgi:hypothetical protein